MVKVIGDLIVGNGKSENYFLGPRKMKDGRKHGHEGGL